MQLSDRHFESTGDYRKKILRFVCIHNAQWGFENVISQLFYIFTTFSWYSSDWTIYYLSRTSQKLARPIKISGTRKISWKSWKTINLWMNLCIKKKGKQDIECYPDYPNDREDSSREWKEDLEPKTKLKSPCFVWMLHRCPSAIVSSDLLHRGILKWFI